MYNPYDVEEFDEYGNMKSKSLLSQYDEEIDGEKRSSFKIGNENYAERKQTVLQNIKEKLSNKMIETLEGPGLTLASEYYSEQELAKFKKPKKKVRKIRVKGKIFTADELEQMKNDATIGNVGMRRIKKEEHMDIDDVPCK